MTIPTDDLTQRDERDLLNAMVLRVAADMQAKLAAKLAQGYSGWGDTGGAEGEYLIGRLLEHVERARSDPRQWLDVCNFAAMLYYGEVLHGRE